MHKIYTTRAKDYTIDNQLYYNMSMYKYISCTCNKLLREIKLNYQETNSKQYPQTRNYTCSSLNSTSHIQETSICHSKYSVKRKTVYLHNLIVINYCAITQARYFFSCDLDIMDLCQCSKLKSTAVSLWVSKFALFYTQQTLFTPVSQRILLSVINNAFGVHSDGVQNIAVSQHWH